MQNKWLILSAVGCGTFMATLDSSIVNVALPSITSSFHTGLSESRWVIISYLFSITSLLLLFGRLADLLGRKLIFSLGFILFTLGSFFCGASQNIHQLILFRAIQGLGASMLMANGPAIITSAFEQHERGKALGTLAMIVSAGLALGPTVGGILVRYLSWPSIFWINLPFGVLGLALVYFYIPSDIGTIIVDPEGKAREKKLPVHVQLQLQIERLKNFDWLGSVLWIFLQVGYSLALDQQNILGLVGHPQKIIIFGSIGLLFLFLLWELSIRDPLLDLSLFRSRLFFTANMAAFFNFVAISSLTLLLPFYLQTIRELPPDKVGIIMTGIPLTIFFVAPISGRLSDRYGSRFLSSIGMIILCLSMFCLSISFQGTGLLVEKPIHLMLYMVFAGLGIGLFQSPNNNAIMGAVKKHQLGVASALLATMRNFGLATGVALSTTILMQFYSELSLSGSSQIHPSENFVKALQHTFLFLSLFCLCGVLASLARGSFKGNRHEQTN